MQKENLLKFLAMLGIKPRYIYDSWVLVSCPLAYWKHEKKQDRNPSCGISFGNDYSVVNCFTCGTRSLADMVNFLFWKNQIPQKALHYFVQHEFGLTEKECIIEDSLSFADKFTKEVETCKPVPENILKLMEKLRIDHAKWLCLERKISKKLLKVFPIFSFKSGVVFGIRDKNMKIYNLRWRCVKEKKFCTLSNSYFKTSESWGNKSLWYGIEYVDFTKPVVLVEGEIDLLRLYTLGLRNVLASCGSLSKEQINRLQEEKPSCLVLGFDNDEVGKQYAKKIYEVFKDKCYLYYLNWSLVSCKDAGDLKDKSDLVKVWKNRISLNDKKGLSYKDKYSQIN